MFWLMRRLFVCILDERVVRGGVMMVFEVCGLCAGYGVLIVFVDVDFDVVVGEFVVVIGLNGYGKIMFLCVISGLLSLCVGIIWFCG